jgi:hypothetical protein
MDVKQRERERKKKRIIKKSMLSANEKGTHVKTEEKKTLPMSLFCETKNPATHTSSSLSLPSLASSALRSSAESSLSAYCFSVDCVGVVRILIARVTTTKPRHYCSYPL